MEQVDPTPHVRDQNCRSRVQERASRIRVENRTDRQQERDRTGRVQTGRMQVDQTQEHVDRVWGQRGASNNRDHTRADVYSNLDHPYQRFCADYELRRAATDEMVRRWESQPVESGPIQCMLCPNGVDFLCRGDWLRHLDEKHGGRQRYRDACLSFAQLAPQVVSGQEWRAIVANFTEFYTRAATDWEKFTPCMQKACSAGQQIAPDMRWAPRRRIGCVFCARSHWLEDLHAVYLAGEQSFVRCPSQVWKMLSVERYAERWPRIATTGELEASAVTIGGHRVLLHKRRVTEAQATGSDPAYVCDDCREAFGADVPWMCKYALANDLWLGRWDPLFRDANLAHQMLLALVRIVTTKVVLRPDGAQTSHTSSANKWDFFISSVRNDWNRHSFPERRLWARLEAFPSG